MKTDQHHSNIRINEVYAWETECINERKALLAKWLLSTYLGKPVGYEKYTALKRINLVKADRTPNENGKQIMAEFLL